MEIFLSKNIGFCFGVKNAIEKVEETLNTNNNVFTNGEIIHNKLVNDKLKEKGLKVIKNIDQLNKGDIFIIRSHGETKEVIEKLKEKGIKIVDTTCPFVKKIQELAKEYQSSQKRVLVLGDKNHPEIKSIISFSNATGIVIKDEVELKNQIQDGKESVLLTQTTFDSNIYRSIKEQFQMENIVFESTICEATIKRQEEIKVLSAQNDAVIVIGDTNSSNTQKLFSIAVKENKNTFLISNIDTLSAENYNKYDKIVLATGTSVPMWQVENLRRKLVNG